MQRPSFIFDGRNILNHDALRKIGYQVYCVGKPGPDAVDMDSF
jgi:UDPglucose 6-dehydrogenase